MKEVDRTTFYEFIAAYPRPLDRDVSGMFDPPVRRFFDWSLAPDGATDMLERCQVAWCFVDDGRGPEHGWHVLETIPQPFDVAASSSPRPEPRSEPPPPGAATYDPREVKLFFGGQEITGLAPDSVIEIVPEPEQSPVVREWTFNVPRRRRRSWVDLAWRLVAVLDAMVVALAGGDPRRRDGRVLVDLRPPWKRRLARVAWCAWVVAEAALVIALAAWAWFATWLAWELR